MTEIWMGTIVFAVLGLTSCVVIVPYVDAQTEK